MSTEDQDRQRWLVQVDNASKTIHERSDAISTSVDGWDGPIEEPDDLDLDPAVGPEIVDEPEHVTSAAAREVLIRRLPHEFWDSRDTFKQIRQAAWATQTHPDAVLAAVLCRVAGMLPHGIKFDSGRGPTGSCNLFACILAGSGIGKSAAAATAENLIEVPPSLRDGNVFKDGIGIGTGEGLAEVYMGWKKVDTGDVDRRGNPLEEKIRAQVRHNAFFYVDEGETINKLMKERQAATLGPAIRTAWNGTTLGQANARDETTRCVKAGTYSLGMLIGYQPDVAVTLLQDVGPGTPQRFLWFGAQDVEMPLDDYDWPGVITMPMWRADAVVTFPTEIKRALRQHTHDKHHGVVNIDPLDSHEPLMRSKLASLLCLIDSRYDVTREDWFLAGMIWATSTSIRDSLVAFRARTEQARTDLANRAKAEETRTVALAQREIAGDVERVAKRIARKVAADGEVVTYLFRKSFGRDKPVFNAGVNHAKTAGWVADTDDGTLRPGPTKIT